MADTRERAETARRHDDSEIIDNSTDAPSQGGRSGGGMARDVGTRDEERRTEEATGITRVRKDDKIQPNPHQKSDHEGAQRDR